MYFLDLPEDVIALIQAELLPQDYLALCRTCQVLYKQYRQDPFYWRTLTSNTFRLPISPLLAADGPRWYWLYKRLKTQTRLYTWGQGLKGNLGLGRALPHPHQLGQMMPPQSSPHQLTQMMPRRGMQLPHRPVPRIPIRGPPRTTFNRTSSSWPTETHIPDEVGVIADLQCGGWSTTILSSDGKLYSVGSLDSLDGLTIGETAEQFTQLQYLTQSTSAIRQFSSGRRHVLALTDDGEVLSWDRVNSKGYKVFSRSGRDFGGRPTRVAAGWGESSAYIPETGIVYWTPIKNDQDDDMLDGLHIKEKIIPGTAHAQREKHHFEVTKHVVLAEFMIWITSDSKLFACSIGHENEDQLEPTQPPFEVPGYAADGRELKDVQGQFQKFGVFTGSGDVLAGNVDYLRRCAEAIRNDPSITTSRDWSSLTSLLSSRPPDVPALQHTGVVALAYGDHHYHALHADGRITSYGTDSMCCGSLGLGGPEMGARFRGLQKLPNVMSPDAKLLPIAEKRGRQVWFEPEKKDWLYHLENSIKRQGFVHEEHPAIQAFADHPDRQAQFSEWIEQEGRHWSDGPQTRHHTAPTPTPASSSTSTSTTQPKPSQAQTYTSEAAAADYHHLDAYFTVAIAAAGWHSGALVLVDENKAHETRAKWIVLDHESAAKRVPGQFEDREPDEEFVWYKEGFPKVRLPDGHVMPGDGEQEREWRDGMPGLAELGLGEAR